MSIINSLKKVPISISTCDELIWKGKWLGVKVPKFVAILIVNYLDWRRNE